MVPWYPACEAGYHFISIAEERPLADAHIRTKQAAAATACAADAHANPREAAAAGGVSANSNTSTYKAAAARAAAANAGSGTHKATGARSSRITAEACSCASPNKPARACARTAAT
jgi:hypothetical protein